MDKLPVEIVDEICTYLDSKHLKALPEVSRFIAEIVIPKVFPSFTIWTQKDSIERLQNESEYPHFQQHLTTLRVPLELFYIAPSGNYSVSACAGEMSCVGYDHPYPGFCECRIAKRGMSHAEFVRIRDDGEQFDGPKLPTALTKVFESLPCLSSITITGDKPKYAIDRPTIHNRPTLRRTEMPHNRVERQFWYEECGRAQFQFLMRSIAAAGESMCLKSLTIQHDYIPIGQLGQDRHFKLWAQGGILATKSSPYFQDYFALAAKAFKNVEKFTWGYYVPNYEARGQLRAKLRKQDIVLGKLLRTMPDLQHFSFTRVGNSSLYPHTAFISVMFSDFTWSNLQLINFDESTINGRSLINFTTRHAASLKEIHLGCVKLMALSTFQEFLRELRERLTLRQFTLGQRIYIKTQAGMFLLRIYRLGSNKTMEKNRLRHDKLVAMLGDFVVGKSDEYPAKSLTADMFSPQGLVFEKEDEEKEKSLEQKSSSGSRNRNEDENEDIDTYEEDNISSDDVPGLYDPTLEERRFHYDRHQ